MPPLARLKQLREAKFLSLQELADKAGVTKQTIYRLEHGANAPYPRTIRKIAEALGVQPAELVGASIGKRVFDQVSAASVRGTGAFPVLRDWLSGLIERGELDGDAGVLEFAKQAHRVVVRATAGQISEADASTELAGLAAGFHAMNEYEAR